MNSNKAERMYSLFGHIAGEKCRDCSNFLKYKYHDRNIQKCEIYGDTRSSASDWTGKTDACGMFNRDYIGRPVIEYAPRYKPQEKIDGQIEFDFVDPAGKEN